MALRYLRAVRVAPETRWIILAQAAVSASHGRARLCSFTMHTAPPCWAVTVTQPSWWMVCACPDSSTALLHTTCSPSQRGVPVTSKVPAVLISALPAPCCGKTGIRRDLAQVDGRKGDGGETEGVSWRLHSGLLSGRNLERNTTRLRKAAYFRQMHSSPFCIGTDDWLGICYGLISPYL